MLNQNVARKWVVKRIGSEGFGLQHRDENGHVQQVESMDPVRGDSLNDCRYYFAEFGQWMDLFYEPNRVFVKMAWGLC